MARTGRPRGSKNKIPKPEFVRTYESMQRRFKVKPLEILFMMASRQTADGQPVDDITRELQLRACDKLISIRYSGQVVAEYETKQLQQDMFDSDVDNRVTFGLPNAA